MKKGFATISLGPNYCKDLTNVINLPLRRIFSLNSMHDIFNDTKLHVKFSLFSFLWKSGYTYRPISTVYSNSAKLF
jgi:hypothetical protein